MIENILENRIQLLAVAGSFVMLVFIIELIRRKLIKEEYSLLWLFSGLLFFVLSVWRDGLESFSKLVGISYPPASLLLVLVLGGFAIMVHFSIVITKLSERNKTIVQELSLLKREFEKFKENKEIK